MSYAPVQRGGPAGAPSRQQTPQWLNVRLASAVVSFLFVVLLLGVSVSFPRLLPVALVTLLIIGAAWWVAVKKLPQWPKSPRRPAGASALPPGDKPVPEPEPTPQSGPGSSTASPTWPHSAPNGAAAVQPYPGHQQQPGGQLGSGRPDGYQQPNRDSHPNYRPHQHSQPQLRPAPSPAVHSVLGPGSLRPLVFVRPSAFGAVEWRLPHVLAQPGLCADQARVGDLALRAASIVGRGHRHASDRVKPLPRQDAYHLGTVRCGERGYLLVAVSDGTSSAADADLGASVATVGAVSFLKERLANGGRPDDQTYADMFYSLARIIAGIARDDAKPARAYTTTLLTAVIPDAPTHPDGSREAYLSWIGDSPAWVLGREGWRQAAGPAKGGLDHNTLTASLPGHPEGFQRTTVTIAPGSALALMTDGLGDVLTDISSSQAELARRWAAPPSLLEFLRDLDLDAPGQDDDRTGVIVWCPAGRQAAP